MSLLGKQITLKGLSQKGKNRIRDNGEKWIVLGETDQVLFSPGKPGPWLFITPVGCDQHHRAARWIKETDDTDFLITAKPD